MRETEIASALAALFKSAKVSDSALMRMTAILDRIICIGGATIDRKYHAIVPTRRDTSNPVRCDRSFGGVARNVAENLARLGVSTSLVTLVGEDDSGRSILSHIRDLGVDTRWSMSLPHHATAEYVAVLEPNGDLALGLADMRIFESFDLVDLERIDWSGNADWVFAECNLPRRVLKALIRHCREGRVHLALSGVSVLKALRLPVDLGGIDLLVLNQEEAETYLGEGRSTASEQARALLARGASHVIVTCGANGVVIGTHNAVVSIPAVAALAVDVTGAGDSLTAATLLGLSDGLSLEASARLGTLVAALTIESPGTVRPDLSPGLLKSAMHRLNFMT